MLYRNDPASPGAEPDSDSALIPSSQGRLDAAPSDAVLSDAAQQDERDIVGNSWHLFVAKERHHLRRVLFVEPRQLNPVHRERMNYVFATVKPRKFT